MSRQIFQNNDGTVLVVSYCGPMRVDGGCRQRLQISVDQFPHSTLDRADAVALQAAISLWLKNNPL